MGRLSVSYLFVTMRQCNASTPRCTALCRTQDLDGPWTEDAVLDVASLQGEKCLPLPGAVTARYLRLAPGVIEWQSIPPSSLFVSERTACLCPSRVRREVRLY